MDINSQNFDLAIKNHKKMRAQRTAEIIRIQNVLEKDFGLYATVEDVNLLYSFYNYESTFQEANVSTKEGLRRLLQLYVDYYGAVQFKY